MRRSVAVGALLGVLIALAFTLTMPSRQVRSVEIPTRSGERVAVYGALAPYAPRALSRATMEQSPHTARDVLLGLLAGGFAAAALVAVGRPRPVRSDL